MSQTHNTVFISYRRSASWSIARLIYSDLKANGYDVFMDVASIDSGTFDTIILRQIEARAHFLLVCAPGTFDRINQPGDWLRREIEHALAHGRNVVPVFVENFSFNSVSTALTGKLADLPRYNGVDAPHSYFEEAMTRLRTRFLKRPVSVAITATPAADRAAVVEKQREVEQQPAPSGKQLTAQDYFKRAYDAHQRGELDNAAADYTEAIRLNPQFADAYNNRGWVELDRRNYDAAMRDVNRAIELDPNHYYAYSNRGVARKAKGDTEGAIADYSEAIRLDPKYADAYSNRGVARKAKGDTEGAIADYNEAIRLNPQYAHPYNNRGIICYDKGEYDKAIADYTEAIRFNPQFALAHKNRAIAHKAKGNYGSALDDFQRYLDLGGGKQYGDQAAVESDIRDLKKKLGRA